MGMLDELATELKIGGVIRGKLSRDTAEKLQVRELQKLVRDAGNPDGLSTWTIKTLRRDELLPYFCEGVVPAEHEEPATTPAVTSGDVGGVFTAVLAETINRTLETPEHLERIGKAVNKALDTRVPRKVQYSIQLKDKEQELIGRQHKYFELVLRLMTTDPTKVNLMLVGAAGCGKTVIALNVAKALGHEDRFTLYPLSCMTTKSDIEGYMNAEGRYVQSRVVKAFTEGHILILDEFDSGNGAVLTLLNAMIGNRVITLPDGRTVKAHEQFRPIAALNTFGLGATIDYSTRNALDGATLDRFAALEVPYDEGLENLIAAGIDSELDEVRPGEGGKFTPEEWVRWVQAYRQASAELSMNRIISPRASIAGCEMIRAGIGKRWIKQTLIHKELDQDAVKRLESKAKDVFTANVIKAEASAQALAA